MALSLDRFDNNFYSQPC